MILYSCCPTYNISLFKKCVIKNPDNKDKDIIYLPKCYTSEHRYDCFGNNRNDYYYIDQYCYDNIIFGYGNYYAPHFYFKTNCINKNKLEWLWNNNLIYIDKTNGITLLKYDLSNQSYTIIRQEGLPVDIETIKYFKVYENSGQRTMIIKGEDFYGQLWCEVQILDKSSIKSLGYNHTDTLFSRIFDNCIKNYLRLPTDYSINDYRLKNDIDKMKQMIVSANNHYRVIIEVFNRMFDRYKNAFCLSGWYIPQSTIWSYSDSSIIVKNIFNTNPYKTYQISNSQKTDIYKINSQQIYNDYYIRNLKSKDNINSLNENINLMYKYKDKNGNIINNNIGYFLKSNTDSILGKDIYKSLINDIDNVTFFNETKANNHK